MALRGIPSIAPHRAIGKPPGATNYCLNGNVATNTTGWGTSGSSTIARSTEQVLYGTHSLKVTYVDNVDFVYYSVTLPAAGTYTHACSVYIPTAWDGTAMTLRIAGFTGSSGGANTSLDMTKRDQWQYVYSTFTVVAGDLAGFCLYVRADGAPTSGRFIYVSNGQIVAGGPVPYIPTDGGTASRGELLVVAP